MAARLARAIGASVAASLALASWHAQAITLVRDGQPNAVIVVSAEAFAASAWDPSVSVSANEAAKVRLAAADLQQYILRMSGALLPIVEERSAAIAAAPALVLVGSSRATGGMRLRIPQGITRDRKEEGFVLRVERHALVLAGNDAGPYNGTYFAVAEFLERQGVRWFMPGEFGEQVPRKPTIEASDALDERHSPDFIVRAWSGNLAPELRAEEAIWRLRNRLTIDADAVLALPTDSSLRNYLPDADVARAHPELFARRADGSVDEHMPSLSNPAMAAMVAGKLKAQIRLRRAADASFASIGISPDDGLPVDLAPETTRRSLAFTDPLGRQGVAEERSISEEWFRFVGAVIAEVAKEFPDVIVTTSAYSNRMTPPEGVAIPANMGIMFAAIWADMLHAYDDPKSWQQALHGAALRRWAAVSPHVLVYNYDEPMLVNALTALPLTRRIVRNTRLARRWGVVGFHDEQSYSWMAQGIASFYLRARLYWNADADAGAILDDYYARWYGPAAAPAKAFWDRLEAALEDTPLLGHEDRILPFVYTPQLLQEMEASLREAQAAAASGPYARHVQADRYILEHLKAYREMSWAELTGDFAGAIRHADAMFDLREKLRRISPFFYTPESDDPARRYFSGSFYWNLTQRREHYRRVLELTGGRAGDLVAVAPRHARFAVDPLDEGRYLRWHEPGFDRSAWATADTAVPFYLQNGLLSERGAPYTGYLWYVFDVEVPATAAARAIHLYAPAVVGEAWVWTNGKFSGHRPYQAAYERPATLDLDVSADLAAGHNVIAVRIDTTANRVYAPEGFQGPLLLYALRAAAR